MHEPDIAPLARRLAEENNVDWRRLQGSGEGGRVVERDVLGYLARVMAGEEAVDPTPEPVPDGMAAWPAGDVAGPGARGDREPETDSPPTLDDELFLFDDPVPAPPPPAAKAEAERAAEAPPAAEAAAVVDDEPVTVVDGDESEGDLLLVGDEAPPAAGPIAARGWDDDVRLDELPDMTDPVRDGLSDAEASADRGTTPGGLETFDLPELFASDEYDAAAAAVDDGLFLEDAADASGGSASQSPDLVPDLDAEDALPASEPAPVFDEPVDEPASAPDTVAHDAPGPAEAPTPPPLYAVSAEAVAMVEDAPAPAEPVPPVAAAEAWVRHGPVWRRRVDDRLLRRTVSEVAAALDAPPATVLALLVGRAARRAGATAGPVDVWRWRRGGAERIAVDVEGPLRDAVHRLETAAARPGGAAASMVVADLSELDLDEAVLHLEVPVLALGRAIGDGAWISLSGDRVEDATVGALAQVAELIASPVRLLV